MEAIATYDTCADKPSIVGEKRMLSSGSSYSSLPEKRQMSAAAFANIHPSKDHATERGEKRSAKDLAPIPQEEKPRQPTSSELEEREMIRKIAEHVLALPVEPLEAASKTSFHGINEPGIAFQQYIERLVHYANVWAHEKPNANSQGIRCAVLAVEYMERAQVRISKRSVHRLFLVAFLIGIKLTDDFGMSNGYWGKAGGCTLNDLNRMEIEFCNMLRWDFGVHPEVYEVRRCKFI